MFLEALVCGKITFLLSPHPPVFPFLSAPHTALLFPMAGIPTVAPPSVWPAPRPDVTPPSVGTFLLYAQGQQIGSLPLNGTRLQKDTAKTLLSLHVKWLSPVGEELLRAVPGEGPEMEGGSEGFPGWCGCVAGTLTDQGCSLIGSCMGHFRVVRMLRQYGDPRENQQTLSPSPQGSFNAQTFPETQE